MHLISEQLLDPAVWILLTLATVGVWWVAGRIRSRVLRRRASRLDHAHEKPGGDRRPLAGADVRREWM